MAFFYLNVTLLKEISELQITAFPKSDKSKEIKVDMVIIPSLTFRSEFLLRDTCWKSNSETA